MNLEIWKWQVLKVESGALLACFTRRKGAEPGCLHCHRETVAASKELNEEKPGSNVFAPSSTKDHPNDLPLAGDTWRRC